MTLLKIIEYPDPFLANKAKPVENIDNEILKLIEDMAETMFNAPGVGLAAPQVRSGKRIIVYNPNAKCTEDNDGSSEKSGDKNELNQGGEKQNKNNNTLDNKETSISKRENEYKAIINPEIIAASGSLISENEACLSVPDYSADVKRFSRITVKGLNTDGKKIQFDADDIMAVIIQHEIDHLNGILYIDRISMLKRNIYKKRMKKKQKTADE